MKAKGRLLVGRKRTQGAMEGKHGQGTMMGTYENIILKMIPFYSLKSEKIPGRNTPQIDC